MVKLKRRPNGYGTVKTLSGRRACPYLPCITINGEQKPLVAFENHDNAFKALEVAKLRLENRLSAKDAEKIYGDIYKCIEDKINTYISPSITNNITENSTIPTFKDIFKIIYDEKYSKLASAKQKISWFNNLNEIHNIPINKIDYDDMQNILNKMRKKGRSSGTLTQIKVICSDVFRYAVIKKYVKRDDDFSYYLNVQSKTNKKNIHIPFSIPEIKKLINYNTREAKIVLIYIFTGCRPIELYRITSNDIYLGIKTNDSGSDKIISYLITGSKTDAGKERIVPIHDLIKPYIIELLKEGKKYLFMDDIKNMSYTFRYNFDKLMDELEFSHLPYDTRHTFNTLAKKYKVDNFARKRIVGHKFKDITDDVYTHSIYGDLFDEINKIKI